MDANQKKSEELPEIINNIKQEPPNEFLLLLSSYNPERRLNGDVFMKEEIKIENSETAINETDFKCRICHKVFGYLKLHMKTHNKQQCIVCLKNVPTKSFEKHMKIHEGENKRRNFQCKVCSVKFLTANALSDHSKVHKKLFGCDLCGYFSSHKEKIARHMLSHFHSGKYKCIRCKKIFDHKEKLRLHARTIHSDPLSFQKMRKKDLTCQICNKEFSSTSQRNRHDESHAENVECTICLKSLKQSSLKGHLKVHEFKHREKKFSCSVCQIKFYTNFELKQHVKRHNKNFTCKICDRKFALQLELNEHLKFHNDPDAFKCKLCDRKLSTHASLKRHMKSFHPQGQPIVKVTEFICKVCKKECRDAKTLYNHERIHQTKSCTVCSKTYSINSYSVHMKMHELRGQEKKFKCEKCSKLFLTKVKLKYHLKTHEKAFKCDLCGHRAAKKSQLRNHLLVHINPETFKCEFCARIFTFNENLKRHLKTHQVTHQKGLR